MAEVESYSHEPLIPVIPQFFQIKITTLNETGNKNQPILHMD
jgi:hypothetical protein